MTTRLTEKYSSTLLVVTTILLAMFFTASAFAANYTLEITQPQPNLTTTSRFYKAYPGLEYNVRMGVIGGAYPYTYSLTTYPSGMTINADTGVIQWSNPTTSGSPHNVTVKVVDQEGTVVTRSWTITVTASGFYFIDAVNGSHEGTGTIASPWKSMIDMYEGNAYANKTSSTYSGGFVYWRQGTYYLDAYIEDGVRIPFVSGYKPVVWMAYPGETPTFDYQNLQYSIYFYSGNKDIYLDGLSFINMGKSSYGLQIDSGSQRTTLYRVRFSGLGATAGMNNQSFIRVNAGSEGFYWVTQNCVFNDLDHGAAVKYYRLTKSLIEDSVFSNLRDSLGQDATEGIALKQDIKRATVRGNTIYNIVKHGVGGNMNGQTWATGDFEVLYNNFYNCSKNCIALNQNQNVGKIYVYRNTIKGNIGIYATDSADGPFYFNENVIINSVGGNKLTYYGTVDASRIIPSQIPRPPKNLIIGF